MAETRDISWRGGVRHMAAPPRRERRHRTAPGSRHPAGTSRRRPVGPRSRDRASGANRPARRLRAGDRATASRSARDIRAARRRGTQAPRNRRAARYHRGHVETAAPPGPDVTAAAIEWSMTVHDSWTDKLSDYLDDELSDGERKAVAAHLAECPGCMSTLEELQPVAAAAAALAPIRPRDDLWSGIASRIGSAAWTGGTGVAARAPRRFSFSLTELAAASLLLAALSGGAVAILMVRSGRFAAAPDRSAAAAPVAVAVTPDSPGLQARMQPADEPGLVAVRFADGPYDAAVADLEQAMENGWRRIDGATFSVV